jgi:hypothetical protein
MLRFRSCKKCGGDLVKDNDQYGNYWLCLQCGWDGGEILRYIPIRKIDHRFRDFRRVQYASYYRKVEEEKDGHQES